MNEEAYSNAPAPHQGHDLSNSMYLHKVPPEPREKPVWLDEHSFSVVVSHLLAIPDLEWAVIPECEMKLINKIWTYMMNNRRISEKQLITLKRIINRYGIIL
jgi:hypothetical protein